MDDLYNLLKERAYGIAATASGKSNVDAQAAGFRDVYDLLLSDNGNPRQITFLLLLMQEMPEDHRRLLLDGMAREYTGREGWLAYVGDETS